MTDVYVVYTEGIIYGIVQTQNEATALAQKASKRHADRFIECGWGTQMKVALYEEDLSQEIALSKFNPDNYVNDATHAIEFHYDAACTHMIIFIERSYIMFNPVQSGSKEARDEIITRSF